MPRRRATETKVPGLPSPSGGQPWPATAWDVIRRAREGNPADRQKARDWIVLRYYKPVRRFFSRALRVEAGAVDDVTQDFFTRFIDKDFLASVVHEKSFRNFLKVACRRHFLNWCEAQKARRVGREVPLEQVEREVLTEETSGSALDEELRSAHIESAVKLLEEKLTASGKPETFRIFEARVRFAGDKPTEYAALAESFGMRVYDVRNRLASARKLFRSLLLEVVSEHSEDPQQELEELDLARFLD